MTFIDTYRTNCPHCGESIELVIDASVEAQDYVEDCEVCCRPIVVCVQSSTDGRTNVSVERENE